MRRLFSLLTPDRIGTQIAMLVVVALAVAQAVMMAGFFVFERRMPFPGEGFASVERIRFLARMVDSEADPRARAALIEAAMRTDAALRTFREPPAPASPPPAIFLLRRDWSQRTAGGPTFYVSHGQASEPGAPLIVVKLTDGTALATALPPPPVPLRLLSPGTVATLVALTSVITILSFWAARQLTAPLARFAETAEQFTSDVSSAPVREGGPFEIRRAMRALNDMQQRVLKSIADRTRMLAAVSHDLRTPITRLRLRAEEIEDVNLRTKVLDDLSMMQSLIGSALSFLRGQADRPQKVKTDVASLVQTVCDGFSDSTGRVSFKAAAHPYVMCEPDDLIRAISNLIENGLKFGHSVDVMVLLQGPSTVIDVCDDGPGIPDPEKGRVFEPFYRGDAARTLNNGEGFGLGLSIAQGLVERNNGSLELLDRSPGGLIARIEIPSVS